MHPLFITFLILAAGAIAWALWFASTSDNIGVLKANYERALSGTDRKAALIAGRAYYNALRRRGLTVYDELAIANDLSTMKHGEPSPDRSEVTVS